MQGRRSCKRACAHPTEPLYSLLMQSLGGSGAAGNPSRSGRDSPQRQPLTFSLRPGTCHSLLTPRAPIRRWDLLPLDATQDGRRQSCPLQPFEDVEQRIGAVPRKALGVFRLHAVPVQEQPGEGRGLCGLDLPPELGQRPSAKGRQDFRISPLSTLRSYAFFSPVSTRTTGRGVHALPSPSPRYCAMTSRGRWVAESQMRWRSRPASSATRSPEMARCAPRFVPTSA